ncbi:DUF1697 domain-containing protein [Flagellimonas aquimarina]|jgi:uncharacterized protein (DUF1697 family)|uniref:DUF1697 domain-containing protein n=1 Tax=Flagellimonas aquimarina TaxID=2201895 RepID=A0A316L4D2_9FLAO|nr:DUF1697 domain-containing protein [Allomuricauda koreensis]PWL40278.1 DUF1697 domain-containing protein [Allomuricauda koreensis]
MKTYIALLRGINVSGQKKIKMVDLKQTLENSGLQNVKTYIQSGNIVFDSETTETDILQDTIYDAILNDFTFEVPVLVKTSDQMEQILAANPFADEVETNRLYFVLLKKPPSQSLVDEFSQLNFVNEDFKVTNACVYLCCKKGYGNAKLNNNLVERKIKVQATTRNLKTMQKLVEMTKEA